MPAYNSEATIAESLDSLLAQTRSDWEAIVVDDGSIDGTAAIAQSYAERDSRFTVISKANGGTASARNLAASRATADLWSLLDADDAYLPEYFERMGAFITAHPDFDIYSCSGYFFRAGEDPWPDELPDTGEVRSFTVEEMLASNRFSVHAVFRREIHALVGGFCEDPRMILEDYHFWLTAMLRGARQIHDPERLWMYRVSAGQKTGDQLPCLRSNVHMLDTVLAAGELDRDRARIARASRRALLAACGLIQARTARDQLERRLARGDYAHARTSYLQARRGYWSPVKYLAGLAVIAVSPRLFARTLTRAR
jgi:glycosyltransferase involved in cell wall biosynthesis